MLISIITPTKNAGSTLAETLESVMLQRRLDVEHLIVDGCSTDETLGIVARQESLSVSSEPDCGIYDAMNKGARRASGKWLLFLQADDWLPEGALDAYMRAIQSYPDAEIICGCAEAIKKGEVGWKSVWKINDVDSRKLSVRNIALGEPMINARLIRKDVFERIGGFSLEYSLASDRDFLLRAAQSGVVQVDIAEQTYRYRWHQGSSTMTDGNALSGRLLRENLAIAANHLRFCDTSGRRDLCRWQRNLTVQGAMNALETRASGMAGYVFSGCSVDILWPFVFLAEILKSLPGFIARGCKTKSSVVLTGGKLNR